jgi:hypothetical protein
MRGYWIRIGAMAVLIFGVGMAVWSMVKSGRDTVDSVIHSTEPITIPLAFIPFSLDGVQLGTMRQVQILRRDEETVSAVNIRVKLADSVDDARLASCVLVARDDLGKLDTKRVFHCASSTDTSGLDLAPVGEIVTQRGGTFVLLAKAGVLDSIKLDFNADSVEAAAEMTATRAESLAVQADSLAQVHSVLADSIRRSLDSTLREAREQVQEARRAAIEARRQVRAEVPVAPAAPR